MSTIAAISTGQAAGGIGIVRISGENAVSVADRIFESVSGIKLEKLKGYRAAFGKVKDDGKYLDEAVALVFRAPKSYTGEDVVELSCHGGLLVTKQVLRAALKNGAVPAEPGEFTKRAFLNGKMDLTEAESVMNIICAKSEQAKSAALTALEGTLYKRISEISGSLKGIAAQMAAWVDYPDDEIEDLSDERLLSSLENSLDGLRRLISDFDTGRIITEGVETAIIGRPNVGKSTLMNMLTGYEKSIVTSVAGTTRDIVEESVTLGNTVLHLADTAGLRETEDTVEKIGVDRTRKKSERASLILAVFDASEELNDEDEKIFDLCHDKLSVAVINKTDLEQRIDTKIIDKNFKNVVYISAKEQNGLEMLEKTVEKLLGTEGFDTSAPMLMNERQLICCSAAADSVEEAITALKSGMTRDAVNVSIDSAVESLDTLTGERATESVVNEIFSRFCVGK
ncbi:MAG: tRNA uridine-5-carboxymethylaminomethyl(34) synthesis GTPase MnmE [Ruminococcaceae bacterium]|nr:tRNA uridine-5-carboxymethylaminomethyl(34) synthesis GTPase MnmE [Oscillospiraceae bacterium]